MKPRLLIILNRLAIGGPAMNTLAIARSLSMHYEVLCIAGKPLKHEHSAEHLLKYYTGFRMELIDDFKREVFLTADYAAYKKIKSIIRDFKPDIVHTHGSKPGILGRWAAHRLNVPLIIHTYHGHVFHGYFSRFISGLIVLLERRMAKYTHIIVAINRQLEYDLRKKYKIASTDKIRLIPLGLDFKFYNLSSVVQRDILRKRLGLAPEDIAVAAIGRIVPVKNHRLFIQIAIRLLRTHPEHPFKFYLIGDGSERDALKEMIIKEGFTFEIGEVKDTNIPFRFLLWRTDIPDILNAVDILLHTSINEGTPVSILEAMAMGKPVVATPVGGIPELFDAAKTGYVSDNESLLADMLLKLAANQSMREEWGSRGRVFINERINIEAQAERLEEIMHNQ